MNAWVDGCKLRFKDLVQQKKPTMLVGCIDRWVWVKAVRELLKAIKKKIENGGNKVKSS